MANWGLALTFVNMKRMSRRFLLGVLVIPAWWNLVWAQGVTVSGQVTLIHPAAHHDSPDKSDAVIWLTPLESAANHVNQVAARLPQHPLRLVQKNKRFSPHILVVGVGSVVEFPNFDPLFHNVFSLFEGKRFDLGLYEAGTTRTVNFNVPGICYIFCNIHPEMSAVVVVLRTPYYAVSNRAGEVSISNVPPGRYELRVWHERCLPEVLASASREVTLRDTTDSFGMIHLIESNNLVGSHKNKYGRDYEPPTPSSPLYEQP